MLSQLKFPGIFCFFLLGLLLPTSLSAQYFGAPSPLNPAWTLGLRLGGGWIDGDIAPLHPNFDLGIYGQKNIKRQIDVRFGINGGIYRGQDFLPSRGYLANPTLNGQVDSNTVYRESDVYFQNFQTQWADAYFQLKINLNRLFSDYGQEEWDLYLLGGVGALFSQTRVNAMNESQGSTYDYSSVIYDVKEKVEIWEALDQIQDNTYETLGERDFVNTTIVGGYVLNSQLSTGAGLRFRLGEKFYLGAQVEYIFVGNDLLDGQQWIETQNGIQASTQSDKLLRMGITLEVEP